MLYNLHLRFHSQTSPYNYFIVHSVNGNYFFGLIQSSSTWSWVSGITFDWDKWQNNGNVDSAIIAYGDAASGTHQHKWYKALSTDVGVVLCETGASSGTVSMLIITLLE